MADETFQAAEFLRRRRPGIRLLLRGEEDDQGSIGSIRLVARQPTLPERLDPRRIDDADPVAGCVQEQRQ